MKIFNIPLITGSGGPSFGLSIPVPVTLSTPAITVPVIPTQSSDYVYTVPYLPRINPIDNNCDTVDIATGSIDSINLDDVRQINVEYKADTFGDIGVLSNGELVKFIKTNLTASAIAKPAFIHNSFIINSSSAPSLTIYNNLSYTQPTNLKPWYDSYQSYFQNIKHLSQDRSVIPEFIVSNFDNIANDGVMTKPDCEPVYYKNYETLYGRDYFLEIENSAGTQDLRDFDELPFEPFLDRKSNKLKIVLNGIKKLLPYNGFYPSEYSKNIIGAFADAFLYGKSELEKMAIVQPFFGPGIFFNTIKAGIPNAYPTYITSSTADFTISNAYSKGKLKKLYTDKVTFEDLLEPERILYANSTGSLIYADPARYISYFGDNSDFIIPSSSTNINYTKQNLQKYKKITENFLAETVHFFLENEQLTRFTSNPQTKFLTAEVNKQYGMEIKLDIGENFSLISPTKNAPESVTSLFGPKFIIADEALHAPPYLQNTGSVESSKYLYGDTLVLYYTHTESLSLTAQNIFDNLYVATGSSGGVLGGLPLVECRERAKAITPINTVLDAIEINIVQGFDTLQRTVNANITRDVITGVVQRPIPVAADYIEIKTKFETPLVNFIDKGIETNPSSSYDLIYSSSTGYDTGSLKIMDYSFDGIWNRYGALPEGIQSIQLGLSDKLFSKYSLLNLLGFKKEAKNLGVIANNKTVKEAIMLIPYHKPQSSGRVGIATAIEPSKLIEFKKFIPIEEDKINKLLGIPNYRKLKINEIKAHIDSYNGKENSIIKTLRGMINYNIPPHLNWLWDVTIDPFVVYFGEFSHQMNRQELADIWQGTMPQIAEVPREQEIVIEHDLTSEEVLDSRIFNSGEIDTTLFGTILLRPGDLYFKVLKVKQRGHYKYSQTREGSIEVLQKDEWYSYNWPYDYFSLVELLNIKAGEVYTSGSV